MKQLFLIIIPLAFVAFSTDAQSIQAGQAAEVRGEIRQNREGFRQDREILQADRAEQQAINAEVRAEAQASAEANRVEVRAELDAAATPEERQAILSEARTEREENQAEYAAKREEQKSEATANISARTNTIIRQLVAGIDRGEQIYDRILEVTNTYAEKGMDVVSAQVSLESAITAQSQAESELATTTTIMARLDTNASNEELRTVISEIKNSLQTAHGFIKDMYANLRTAHSELTTLRDSNTQITGNARINVSQN